MKKENNMKRSIIAKVKEIFNAENTEVSTEEVVENKFVEVKTNEGRILRADDIAVESAVVEITEDGEVALEDATYVLEDGLQLVVVAGIITEVIEAEVEEESEESEEAPVAEEEMSEETEEEVEEEFSAEAKELFSQVSEMVQAFNSLKSEITSLKEENEALKTKVNKFAGEPSAEETKTKAEFSVTTKEDKLKFFGK
jgi:hypothetical protein